MAAARADRLYERLASWLGRGVLLAISGVLVMFVAWLLHPGFAWVLFTLAALLIAAGLLSMVAAIVILGLWFLARHTFYRQLPVERRREVYQNELRMRGAPAWYLRSDRRVRVAYVLSTLVLSALFILGLALVAGTVRGRSGLIIVVVASIAVPAVIALINRPAERGPRDRRLQVAAGEAPVGEPDHRQKPGDHPADVGDR